MISTNDYKNARTAFIVCVLIEGVLAIPLFGWWFARSTGFMILMVTFLIHVIALFLGSKINLPTHAPIIGIIASLLGWVPLLGWFLHVAAFLFYLITLMGLHTPENKKKETATVEPTIKDADIEEA